MDVCGHGQYQAGGDTIDASGFLERTAGSLAPTAAAIPAGPSNPQLRTSQNFAHAEEQFRAAAETGAGLPDEELRHRLEMVARAYDPCISCSVQVMRLPDG